MHREEVRAERSEGGKEVRTQIQGGCGIAHRSATWQEGKCVVGKEPTGTGRTHSPQEVLIAHRKYWGLLSWARPPTRAGIENHQIYMQKGTWRYPWLNCRCPK